MSKQITALLGTLLEKKENVLFLGNSGVGKTHLSVSIGIAAAKKRNST
ncbi:ATP-binding protein, partial [Shewanella chilikensis]